MLRGSCFVSVPSSEMELTSADFVTLGGGLLQGYSSGEGRLSSACRDEQESNEMFCRKSISFNSLHDLKSDASKFTQITLNLAEYGW